MAFKTRTRMLNEMEKAKVLLHKRYGKLVTHSKPTRSSRADVRKLQLEQKEHLMYLLALELGAPYRHDLGFIAKRLNITVQASRYLMDHPKWASISKRVMDKIRSKYLILIHGKSIEYALNGSKYHTDLMLNLEEIVTKRVAHIHEQKAPVDPKERDAEIDRLQAELAAEELSSSTS